MRRRYLLVGTLTHNKSGRKLEKIRYKRMLKTDNLFQCMKNNTMETKQYSK